MSKNTIVFSSGNPGKIKEVQSIFKDSSFEILPQSSIGVHEGAAETACTFVENSLLKARFVSSKTKYPVIADDSGIVINALNKEPGVFSARYAGEKASDQDNISKVIRNLKKQNLTESPAKFIAVIVYVSKEDDPVPIITQGELTGRVIIEPRGNNGFGYDPIFCPDGFEKTLAEIPEKDKTMISHRGIAFRKLLELL